MRRCTHLKKQIVRGGAKNIISCILGFCVFFYNLKATTIKTFIMVQELEFTVGDYLLSKRFGWQYKIISIRYGVAVIQDIVRENVRMKFSLSALHARVKNDSFVHSPLPF